MRANHKIYLYGIGCLLSVGITVTSIVYVAKSLGNNGKGFEYPAAIGTASFIAGDILGRRARELTRKERMNQTYGR
ncbi:MAG TPA: hypothetical protein VJH04_04625 [archaeon]|nr:hypothetical protein [archaeon]